MATKSPLVDAVKKSKLSLVEVLVQQEDVNQQNKIGNTPLHHAVRKLDSIFTTQCHMMKKIRAQLEIILSLAAKADVTLRNREGKQPIHLYVECIHVYHRSFHHVSLDSDLSDLYPLQEKVMESLVTPNFGNHDYKGNSLLHFSIEYSDNALAEMLITRGADVTVLGEYNGVKRTSALHMLVQERVYCSIYFIPELGKDGMLNAQDENGNTALHIAVMDHNNAEFYRMLKKNNANDSIRNKRGRLPIDEYLSSNRITDIQPSFLNELLTDNIDLTTCSFLQILADDYVEKRGLKELLFTLCERMEDFSLPEIKWKVYDERWRRDECTMIINEMDKNFTFSVEKAEEFSRVLLALPVRIHGVAEPLYSDSTHAGKTEESIKLAKKIDKLWEDHAENSLVLSLSNMCRRIIRKSIYPVRQSKVETLGLPDVLVQFVCQMDVAERLYEIMK